MSEEKNPSLDQKTHFAFGENWSHYAKGIDEAKIRQAMDDLRRLAGKERLDGKRFLDIGCGSGLHALAAIRLGAAPVIAVDIDPMSVATTRQVLQRFAPEGHFEVLEASVFDLPASGLPKADIVYSWGVLHHTGDLRHAIASAAEMVDEHGSLLLALYRKTPFCGVWRLIKRFYSSARPSIQRLIFAVYRVLLMLLVTVSGRRWSEYRESYRKQRGMELDIDIHDWLGGFPYESVSADECKAWLRLCGFAIEREWLHPVRPWSELLGSGCDEFRFRKGL